MNLKYKLEIAHQIALGMKDLHEYRVIHRDIKTHNILLDIDPQTKIFKRLKLCDFGQSTLMDSEWSYRKGGEFTGTIEYMAPEIVKGEKYDEKVDVFSFAIVLWEIFTCETPWKGQTKIGAAILSAIRPNLEILTKTNCPNEIKNLIVNCWTMNSKERQTFEQIEMTLAKLKKELL